MNKKLSILCALLAVFGCAKQKGIVWDELPDQEIQIISVSPGYPCSSETRGVSYAATNLVDKNLSTSWQLNLGIATQQGLYVNGIIKGPVFTLNSDKIGTIAIRNGYSKTEELYLQNARARSMSVYNENTGELIAQFNLPDDFNVCLCKVNKVLTAGVDGSYRVRIDYGTLQNPGVYPGTKYQDFVISEVQFFLGPNPQPVYHVGMRAYYGVKGPVASFNLISMVGDESVSFTKGGILSTINGYRVYANDNSYTISYQRSHSEDYGSGYYTYVYRFDGSGKYISYSASKFVQRYYPEWHGTEVVDNGTISYDWSNNVVGWNFYGSKMSIVVDQNGNRLSETKNGVTNGFTIENVDEYGNWTSRSRDQLLEERVITYYPINKLENILVEQK